MSQGLNYGYSRLLEASEGKETDSPLKAPEVMQPAPSWILNFFFFLTSRMIRKEMNSCCFKPLGSWSFVTAAVGN